MGADLCGYILVGPRKLNKKKVAAAIEHLKETIKLAKQAHDLSLDNSVPVNQIILLKQRLSRVGPQASNGEVLEEAEEVLDVDPLTTVSEFQNMWDNAPYRDMMTRSLPGDKKRKILVCGERTWGDGPDPDSAWGITDAVDRFTELFEMLGIE